MRRDVKASERENRCEVSEVENQRRVSQQAERLVLIVPVCARLAVMLLLLLLVFSVSRSKIKTRIMYTTRRYVHERAKRGELEMF